MIVITTVVDDAYRRNLLSAAQEKIIKINQENAGFPQIHSLPFIAIHCHSFVNELVRLKIIPDRDIPMGLLF